MRTTVAVVAMTLAGVALAVSSGTALAGFPSGFDTTPQGPGTEQKDATGRTIGIRPGWEGSIGAGTGFSGTYAAGMDARVDYTLDFGLVLGGAVQGFWGNSAGDQRAHATFFGPELGYKFFPIAALEVRPYAFVGPAFITQVSSTSTNSKTSFAAQPGGMILYHIGQAFVGGDLRFMATPSPNSAALMATGGAGF
jgi:hypothetical protein